MELIILLVLILINGFFAGSEIALVSSRRSALERMARRGRRGARIALELKDDSERFLSVIQVGITVVVLIMGVFSGTRIAREWSPLLEELGMTEAWAYQIAIIFSVGIVTYLSIVLGELVPKTLGIYRAEVFSVKVAPVIALFTRVFYPFVWILMRSTQQVNQWLGIREGTSDFSESDLKYMLRMAAERGVIDKGEDVLHERLFYFSDKKARHLMTHREQVEWVDLSNGRDAIEQQMNSFRHSKIICANGSLENIRAVIYLVDYFRAKAQSDELDLRDIMLPPTYVASDDSSHSILQMFRKQGVRYCLVKGRRSGRFLGVITMSDVIRNILGYIPEEASTHFDFQQRKDGSYLVNAEANVEVLESIIPGFEVDFDSIDYSSVAGFVISKLGEDPQTGMAIEELGYRIEIVDMDGQWVDTLLVEAKAEPPSD